MATPEYQPVRPWVAVTSLEDAAEEAAEAGEPGNELEMCEVVAAHSASRFKTGQIVFVEPYAFHYAQRLEDALFVPDDSIRAVATEK